MDIIVDSREQKRIEEAKKFYNNVTVKELPVGDYVFNKQVVFEYKTLPDFVGSIMTGRIFNQAINQSETYPYHFIIIELGTSNINKQLRSLHYASGLKTSKYQLYGAISRLNTYTTVIPVFGDVVECFKMMKIQAEKCLDHKPVMRKNSNKIDNPAANFLASSISRIDSVRAEQITSELGLYSLNDLLNITYDDLTSIPGIGDKIAENVIKQLQGGNRN
ncbi:ERCC4 domain-containing protein [uncultured Methanobrevibacter sp.]|uniref:ERCC4 domain-containing protein n=1 Tax=uncultured Methanobrevibacter sp. TaxID=253161 RepID=UPI0026201310|nr:ERCC4 domain-containing protein [uncultured Methanobrevibacter sp.]